MNNRKVKVGDIVHERLMFDKGKSTTPFKGVVIYVHPKGHFYRAEFDVSGHKIRESFSLYGTERSKK